MLSKFDKVEKYKREMILLSASIKTFEPRLNLYAVVRDHILLVPKTLI